MSDIMDFIMEQQEIVKMLNNWQKLHIRLGGKVLIGHFKAEGWKNMLPFYAFRCNKHGIVVNYQSGEYLSLICPYCWRDEVG